MGSIKGGRIFTYADIKLNDTPKHKHRRVAITKLNPINLEIPKHRAQRSEQPKREDANQPKLLPIVDVQLQQQRHGQHRHYHVRHDGYDGIGGEGRARRETLAILEGIPRLVDRRAGKDEGERARQVCQEHHDDGPVDGEAVGFVVGALQEAEVADEEGDLEEADADLVDGSTGEVDPRVNDQILPWPVQHW